MAKKYVIQTSQVMIRRYYVEVEDPTWAHDAIVMGELDEFSQMFGCEDIISTHLVEGDDYPKAESNHSVNGAAMAYDPLDDRWKTSVRWDLA